MIKIEDFKKYNLKQPGNYLIWGLMGVTYLLINYIQMIY